MESIKMFQELLKQHVKKYQHEASTSEKPDAFFDSEVSNMVGRMLFFSWAYFL